VNHRTLEFRGNVHGMDQKLPTAVIESSQREHLKNLPFHDTADFEDTDRGFLAAQQPCVIKAADGRVVWDNDVYSFLTGDAPTSVHPSLWRQSTLNARQGLYEVVEGIYQVRGFDLSNISFVEGDTGVIVIDPLISTEVAAAALQLYREHRGGDRPVVAVIYTHSHGDHFGGVFGVTSQAEVDAGKVAVLAPDGFVEHAVQENVYAGTAMTRRATYMYGTLLARGPQGQVGCGLGQNTSTGEVAMIVPTVDIRETGEKHTIDGVEIEFQMAPGTEAPAEMHFYFPRYRALCMAENATHNLHNLLTLRGALVRDPHGWSGYLTEAIDMFAHRADVAFASHHWPTWGQQRIIEFLSVQRDLYAYLHDQTLRLLNQGYTGAEIAEQFQLPPALEKAWHTHGYYGSVSHNVKAIYQRYMGWFDGNPARLWPHPPEALATRYVDAIGGLDRVVELARKAFDEGDFRWAATLLDHAVFADDGNAAARELYADTLEQLAYGAENATWRNFFLSGATELREGNFGTATQVTSPTMMAQLSPNQMFDVFAISVNGPKAWDLDITIDVTFLDIDTNYRVTLRNGVLVYRKTPADESTANATIKLANKVRLLAAAAGDLSSPGLAISGDGQAVQSLLGVLDKPDPNFNIITP
jgi:alkyl sulfatase BDS1-like metallo-beta-lactamase superfamily hydrolase